MKNGLGAIVVDVVLNNRPAQLIGVSRVIREEPMVFITIVPYCR